ncbi:MAG TPA: CBS domain-containing protein [Casimicrobiaceae bacterium]|nr:CBS domain-containing protein [Casimicrobiaceae bacterium]
MQAKDVMTHSVVTIAPEANIREAIAKMIEHGISGLPVVDEDVGLVGIVTEGDLIRRAETGTEAPRRRWLELLLGAGAGADAYARAHGRHVCDLMSADVVTVTRDTPLADVVRSMEEHSIKRVPVVDGKRVVGIVSRANLVAALSEHLELAARRQMNDDEIQRRIIAQMKREPWCPSREITVIVRKGWVRLEGVIFDERQRKALHVLIAGVVGVKGIDDQLAYIEPLSGTRVDEAPANPVRISD